MSNISQFAGGARPPKVIVNQWSSGGAQTSNTMAFQCADAGCKTVLSGAQTAGVLTTVLSVTGAGEMDICGAWGVDATARTIRIKVVVDGTTVFDATSNSISTLGLGMFAVGGQVSTTGVVPQKISFGSSLLVQIASSLTETNKLTAAFRYMTY